MLKKYAWLWLAWLLIFLGIEFAALRNSKTGDTLSEQVRKLIGTGSKNRTSGIWLMRAGLLGLLVWLIPHFFTGSI